MELTIEDVKSFDKPNLELLDSVAEQFFLKNKEQFLSMYNQLSVKDKFYLIGAIMDGCPNIKPYRKVLAPELAQDIKTYVKLSNVRVENGGYGNDVIDNINDVTDGPIFTKFACDMIAKRTEALKRLK